MKDLHDIHRRYLLYQKQFGRHWRTGLFYDLEFCERLMCGIENREPNWDEVNKKEKQIILEFEELEKFLRIN